MPRRVIIGTQVNPITVRPADLPTNADHSYLRHIRLTGTWGPTRSLRYVDLIQSRCDADLRQAHIGGLESWHSNCQGVRLRPKQADRCTFDLVRAYIMVRSRAYMVNVMGAATADIDELWNPDKADDIPDRHKGSWSTLIENWRALLKTTTAEMRAMYNEVFDEMPNMKQAMRGDDASFVQELKLWRPDPSDMNDTIIPESQFTQPMLNAIQRHDRWALVQAVEAEWPVVAACRRLNPGFDLRAVPRRLFTHPLEWGFTFEDNTSAQRVKSLSRLGGLLEGR